MKNNIVDLDESQATKLRAVHWILTLVMLAQLCALGWFMVNPDRTIAIFDQIVRWSYEGPLAWLLVPFAPLIVVLKDIGLYLVIAIIATSGVIWHIRFRPQPTASARQSLRTLLWLCIPLLPFQHCMFLLILGGPVLLERIASNVYAVFLTAALLSLFMTCASIWYRRVVLDHFPSIAREDDVYAAEFYICLPIIVMEFFYLSHIGVWPTGSRSFSLGFVACTVLGFSLWHCFIIAVAGPIAARRLDRFPPYLRDVLLHYVPMMHRQRMMLAECLLEEGHYDWAQRQCECVIREHPKVALGHGMLAAVYAAQDQFLRAKAASIETLRIFREEAQIPDNQEPAFISHTYYVLGRAHNGLGEYEQGLTAELEALRLRPEDSLPQIHLEMARGYAGLGRHDEAVALFQRYLGLEPSDAAGRYDYALSLRELDRHEEALTQYHLILGAAPGWEPARRNAAYSLLRLERYQEALNEYQDWLKVESDNGVANCGVAHAYAGLGRLPEALAHFQAATQSDPAVSQYHFCLGQTLYKLERYEESIPVLAEALKLGADLLDTIVLLGNALFGTRRHAEALVQYQAALTIDPNEAAASIGVGISLSGLKRYEEAVAIESETVRKFPALSLAHSNLAYSLTMLRQYDQAHVHLSEALHLEQTSLCARNNLARLLTAEGNYDAALAEATSILAIDPGNAEAHFVTGSIYERLGQLDQALAAYQNALVRDSRHEEAQDAISQLTASKTQM